MERKNRMRREIKPHFEDLEPGRGGEIALP